MKVLSLLICHQPHDQWRVVTLATLLANLRSQLHGIEEYVEILIDSDPTDKIGTKRNNLLQRAQGKYIAFIDDDDNVSPQYVLLILEGIYADCDCCSMTGIINEGGKEKKFVHSIRYSAYANNGEFYERYPNHLNTIRAEIAKRFRFPDINHGEDTDFATQIFKSGLIKTEHWIEEVIYYYNPSSNRK